MSFRRRLIGGVVALALVVTMVNLGLWQLRRHDEKQRLNDRVESRMDLEPVGVQKLYEEAVLSGGGGLLGGESGLKSVEYRRVAEIGDFNCEQEVLIRNRTLGGRPGYWVFTPFAVLGAGWDLADDAGGAAGETAGGPASGTEGGMAEGKEGSLDARQQSYIVNRGWLPLELVETYREESTLAAADTPCSKIGVEITGLIRLPRAGAGKECESLAPVCTFAQPDTASIASHLASAAEAVSDSSLVSVNSDFYIQLESVAPPPEDTPVLLGAPSFGAGNHLSYAVQWFIFSTIAAVGYFLIFWRRGKIWRGGSRKSH